MRNEPTLESLFAKRLRHDGLNEKQVILVLKVIGEFCHHCWDSFNDCQRQGS